MKTKGTPITWEQIGIVFIIFCIGVIIAWFATRIYVAGIEKGSRLGYGIYDTFVECNGDKSRVQNCDDTNVKESPYYKPNF